MRNLLRRLGMPMVCAALFSMVGGHWAVFQSLAWAQMLREYSRTSTVAEAVEKTFSGEAPCPMCCAIVKEKQKEEKAPATVKLEKKGELFLAVSRSPLPLRPASSFSYRFPADLSCGSRSLPPADPIPISLS